MHYDTLWLRTAKKFTKKADVQQFFVKQVYLVYSSALSRTLKARAALWPPKPKLSLMATFGLTSGTTFGEVKVSREETSQERPRHGMAWHGMAWHGISNYVIVWDIHRPTFEKILYDR